MAGKVRTVESVVARLATRTHGVVTRRQLLAAGVTEDEIDQRLATGALLREHRGVYRVGHRAPSVEARYLAAVLACGDGALLSGRAAAHIWGLLKGAAGAGGHLTYRTAHRRSHHAPSTPAAGCHQLPRDPDHDRPVHRHCPRSPTRRRNPRPRLPRSRRPLQHDPAPGRRSPPSPPQRARHEAAASRPQRRHQGHPEQTRTALPRAPRTRRPCPTADQPPRRRPPRRLPLALAPPHRRARRLPLPPVTPRMGAGPPARARGSCPGR
jgi:hypothetical protein